MKVFLDTNVLVSAFASRQPPRLQNANCITFDKQVKSACGVTTTVWRSMMIRRFSAFWLAIAGTAMASNAFAYTLGGSVTCAADGSPLDTIVTLSEPTRGSLSTATIGGSYLIDGRDGLDEGIWTVSVAVAPGAEVVSPLPPGTHVVDLNLSNWFVPDVDFVIDDPICRDTPPPPTGSEGCTPGYWKQPHHFGSYPNYYPYDLAPTTLFVDAFEVDAFPGMTLRAVLSQGGGGLRALGRHAVAALLNAASSEVEYALSPAAVVAEFQAAYASSDITQIEQLKNRLEGFNDGGNCPL